MISAMGGIKSASLVVSGRKTWVSLMDSGFNCLPSAIAYLKALLDASEKSIGTSIFFMILMKCYGTG